jgi:hypothetical protein
MSILPVFLPPHIIRQHTVINQFPLITHQRSSDRYTSGAQLPSHLVLNRIICTYRMLLAGGFEEA